MPSPRHEEQGRITRGMCDKHYKRWQRHKNPLFVTTGKPFAKRGPGTCEEDGCSEERYPYKSNGSVSYSPLCFVHTRVQRLKTLCAGEGFEIEVKVWKQQ